MENGYPYGWVLFLKIHAVTSIALHGVSLYLVRALQYYTSVADNEHPSSGEYNQEYYDGADAVPCFLLLWLTFALLLKLQANNKKRMLRLGIRKDTRKDGSLRDRTTSMLLLMLCVFLSTELPQGFMAVLNAIYTKQFHLFVYLPLADVLDLLSLINCYVGFTVFFCTSTRYRQTLLTLFPQQWSA
uniref:G-protein coupled receptors family 1 profile domain-containing protein n=1 Tax=Parascaris equorum TaxID=6256 RepID=A0A914S1Y4_PAREQ